MKKTIITRIVAICCICAATVAMAACGNKQPEPAPAPAGSSAVTPAGSSAVAPAPASGDASQYEDYIGYQFAGKDPWGGELAITVRSIKDGTVELTYTDMPSAEYTVYAECTALPLNSDGTIPISVTGTVDGMEGATFNYVGSLALKDGELVLNYEVGSITTKSDQGDSDSYQVGALSDGEKTIVLAKTVDPS